MANSAPRPIGNLHGDDANWAWAVVDRLNHNDVGHAQINRTVQNLERLAAGTGPGGLYDTFGDPRTFADALTRQPDLLQHHAPVGKGGGDDPLRMSAMQLGTRMGIPVHVGGIVMVFVLVLTMLAGSTTGMMFHDGTLSVGLSAGFCLVVASVVLFLGMMLLAPMAWWIKHPLVTVVGWVVVLVGVIVVGALWSQPVARLPRMLVVATAVVGSVGGSVASWIMAARAKRNPDYNEHVVQVLTVMGFASLIGTWALALAGYYGLELPEAGY